MANIKNSQRSASLGAIADALLSGKSGLNEYEIKKWMPLIGGTGLGDLFMGQAPELVNDISYYGPQAAFKGGNRVSGGLGTLQPKRETFDAAMLGMDATGLAALTAKLGGNLSKAALNKMAIEAGNLSRRNFLKGSAAVAGGAALGGLLKLAKHSTDNVANKVAKEAPKKYKFNSLKEYNDYLNDLSYDAENFMAKGRELEYKRFLAEEEEKLYNKIKFSKETDRLGTVDLFDNPEEVLNAFSPQAKAEMKHFKTKYKAYTDSYNEMKLTDRYHPEFEDYAEGTPYPDIEHWSFFLDDPKTNKLMFDAESLKNYEMLIDNLKTSSIKYQQDHRLYGDYINNSNFTGSFNDYLDTLLKQK